MTTNTGEHILVVDDDPKIRTLLRRCFEPEGYRVSEAGNGEEMLGILDGGSVDLITLDLTLPGSDGFSLARKVRETSAVPIIMVTGKGEMIDRVIGLEIGADDYISKPFHLREVLARVRSVLRRYNHDCGPAPQPGDNAGVGGVLSFAGWHLDPSKRELRDNNGLLCDLTTAEYSLLELLARNPQQVLSRDRLMDLLKGRNWTPYDRVIDTQVARLRKRIEEDPARPVLIKTIRGVGYMFTADVTS